MKTYQVVKLGDVLKRNTKQIRIEDNQKYKQVTVRLWGKGVQLRNEVYGHEIKSDSRYIVKSGQFIVSKIDARNGASGLIPEELDGAIITGDFLSFDINKDLILPEYLLWLSRSEWFIEQCVQASSGTTNRIRLNESKFLQIEISLPNISEQAQIIRKIQDAVQIINNIDLVLTEQKQLTENLRQSILQKAIQGHLVEQDPNDEPAADLLKRIREEKERLIKEKKIKKEKPLPPISPEEIPYELPKGWEWVRFGDITINRDSERVPLSREEREKRKGIYDYYGASGVIDKIDGYLFDKTLLLIGEDGANLINRSTPIAFLAEGKYWVNNHAHVIDAIDITILKYLCIYINSINLEPYITGTAQPKMNQAKLNSIVVALPPLKEQIRIISRVEKLLELCNKLEKRVNSSKSDLQILLQSLLRETFSYL